MKIMRSFSIVGLGLATLGLASIHARAAESASAEINVSATLAAECEIEVTSAAFGSTKGLTEINSKTASANVTITCTNGTSYTVTMEGLNEGEGSQFKMISDAEDTLNYIVKVGAETM